MTPSAVCDFIREQCPADLPRDVSSPLLEYCLLDAIKSDLKGSARTVLYEDLASLQLWPTMDSNLQTAGDLFLPRDGAEMDLFSGSRTTISKTVKLDALTSKVRDILLRDVAHLGTILRFRSLQDLAADWPNMYPVASASDHVGRLSQRSEQLDPLLRDIWTWICRRFKEEKGKISATLHDLWLVPINDCRIRRLGPGRNASPTLIIEKGEPLADIIIASATRNASLTPPLLDTISLTIESVKLLRKVAKTVPDLRFACHDQLDTLLDWLVLGKEMLAVAPIESTQVLLKHLEQLLREEDPSKGQLPELASRIKKLPIFSKTVPCAPSECVCFLTIFCCSLMGFTVQDTESSQI